MSTTPPNAFRDLLASFDEDSQGHRTGQRDRGTGFETLAQLYFQTEPKFQELFSEVLTFGEWVKKYAPGSSGRDTGIDLVGVRRDGSGFEAIQAKFYSPEHTISRKELDSFITASNRREFTSRRIVATSGKWGDNAKATMRTVEPHIHLTTLHDLENAAIDWSAYLRTGEVTQKPRKALREEQQEAVSRTVATLQDGTVDSPRMGRLLMACGTGKTFTSLRIAESLAGPGRTVLFLAPSLHLVSQTLTEWTQQASVPLSCFAVCSDSEVGKKRDELGRVESELDYPATTDGASLHKAIAKAQAAGGAEGRMTVIFSTYHSSPVIGEAQKLGLPALDLVICDEAHRTSGAKGRDEETKAFQFIHQPEGIRRARTVFMTATPRIFSGDALEKAKDADTTLYSMDDEALYGPIIYEISFADAVRLERLCPYKIVVLGVSENEIAEAVPDALRAADNNITLDVASRIIGAWKGLSRDDMRGETDTTPMHKAVAFCSTIDPSKKRKSNIASRVIESGFADVVEEYRKRQTGHGNGDDDNGAFCEVRHVDGSMNAAEKGARLDWLKADAPAITDEATGERREVCRILSNVRCLSEGVDVPALDAVVFLAPSSSEVDVVQSVGRVMRRAPGKERGYIIIPVVVPNGRTADEYFANGSSTFRTVWMVLQALRAHDSSLDDELDRINLGGTPDRTRMEVVCVSPYNAPRRKKGKAENASEKLDKGLNGGADDDRASEEEITDYGRQLVMSYGQREKLADALYARIVQKVGNRNPFARWSGDVKRIVDRHIISITRLLDGQLPLGANHEDERRLEKDTAHARAVFDRLKTEIHASISPNVPDTEIIEMMGQHLVTGPVFDALFGDNGGHASNPMTQALNEVTQALYAHGLTKEQQALEGFYESIRARLTNAGPEARHALTIQLYNDFFREAFRKQADKLGIVYTPVPVVDFIIRSVEHVLQTRFGCGMGDESVSVLDPFTGTGSFIARLIELKQRNEDGSEGDYILPAEKLAAKYEAARKDEAIHGKPGLWANELVLLAYYVASINISTSYTARTGQQVPFGGLCLTDTFNLTEHVQKDRTLHDAMDGYLKGNSERILAQESAPIRVILGNPPYSAGASKAGQAQNDKYEALDKRIEETYAKDSKSTNKNSLYDSYIRAIRWASDRIGEQGIIGFVTNAGFLESAASTGLRNALEREFSEIWIFHLRGNARTSGERRRQEKDNVFGEGSRAPVAITILSRRKGHTGKGIIRFCDIGDYLTAQERYAHDSAALETAPESDKFHWLHRFASIAGIPQKAPDARKPANPEGLFRRWQTLSPDEHGDWLNQRDDGFSAFMTMGSKKGEKGIFGVYSNGLKTQRDAWVWNFSRKTIQESVTRQVKAYETERTRLNDSLPQASKAQRLAVLKQSPDFDTDAISWTSGLQSDVVGNKPLSVQDGEIRIGTYRPFTKEHLFFSRRLNERVYQLPKIFPHPEAENRVICVTGNSASNFSVIMMDHIPDLNLLQAGAQCFPLYHYEPVQGSHPEGDIFSQAKGGATRTEYRKKSAITPEGMAYFRKAWPGAAFDEEDVFYYIYGLLHAPDYRRRYATSLSKELPRIPCVKTEAEFRVLSQAGRKLAELHLNYETAEPWFTLDDTAHVHISNKAGLPEEELFRVEKMTFARTRNEAGKRVPDRTHLIYNDHIEITGIPLEAYDYQVNGKPALDWIMDRQQVKTDKRSTIPNDPNTWAIEREHNPKWPLLLFLKVMRVALETNRLIAKLPGSVG